MLTSSARVMGAFANTRLNGITLWAVSAIVFLLNILLLLQISGLS